MARRRLVLFACVFVTGLVACTQAQQVTRNSGPSPNVGPVHTPSPLPKGTWGGQGISLEIGDEGTSVDFDCAHGKVSEPIAPDRQGNFEAKGTYVPEGFGPVRQGREPREQAVIYAGKLEGETMSLTVKAAESGEAIATYQLTRGRNGRVRKCK